MRSGIGTVLIICLLALVFPEVSVILIFFTMVIFLPLSLLGTAFTPRKNR